MKEGILKKGVTLKAKRLDLSSTRVKDAVNVVKTHRSKIEKRPVVDTITLDKVRGI